MNNTIVFEGGRTGVSSTGNVEWFDFTIISDKKLHDDTVKELVIAHGCGGQDSSFQYKTSGAQHFYKGKSVRYSD